MRMRWIKRQSADDERIERERLKAAEEELDSALDELDEAVEEHSATTKATVEVVSSWPPAKEHCG